jgi:hypothetical protein
MGAGLDALVMYYLSSELNKVKKHSQALKQ